MVMSNCTLDNGNTVKIPIKYMYRDTVPNSRERLTVHFLGTKVAEINPILGSSYWGQCCNGHEVLLAPSNHLIRMFNICYDVVTTSEGEAAWRSCH